MLLSDDRIQKDDKGYFYLRKRGKYTVKERGFKSECITCGISFFSHIIGGENKNKYCSHSCMPIWNKNKKYTKEEKEKLNLSGLQKGRAWNKGKKGTSEETRRRSSDSHMGRVNELAPNWQGGKDIIKNRERERNRIKYKIWRRNILIIDGHACAKCGNSKIELHVHHIKPSKKYPKLISHISNGVTLCTTCHGAEHRKINKEKANGIHSR